MKKILILMITVFCFGNCYSQTVKEYYEKGVAQIKSEKYSEAMKNLNMAIKLEPNAPSYHSRGALKFILKDFRGAILDFTNSIKINPNYLNGRVFFQRGLSKIIMNDNDNGCMDLSKAGELGSEDAYEMIKKYCN